MTLFNQINSLLFALFLLVMSSLVYFQFTETKAFMVNQMESDLNNTVTSLSLMLKPHLETGDEATVDTLVNVIFEGGFYRKVNLTWLADQKVQEWENGITPTISKCWMCVDRLDEGQQPACVEACPSQTRIFGDLDDKSSDASLALAKHKGSRLQEDKGTEPNVFYIRSFGI